MKSVLISVLVLLIGLVLVGLFVLWIVEKNSKEPETERKWTDPSSRG